MTVLFTHTVNLVIWVPSEDVSSTAMYTINQPEAWSLNHVRAAVNLTRIDIQVVGYFHYVNLVFYRNGVVIGQDMTEIGTIIVRSNARK